MKSSLTPHTTRTASIRARAARARDRASGLSSALFPPFAAQGAADLLREQSAATLMGMRDGALTLWLFLVHAVIGLIRE